MLAFRKHWEVAKRVSFDPNFKHKHDPPPTGSKYDHAPPPMQAFVLSDTAVLSMSDTLRLEVREVDQPILEGVDDVIIKVNSVALTAADRMRLGEKANEGGHHVMGYSVSGLVVAMGIGVTECKRGDTAYARVWVSAKSTPVPSATT